MSAQQSDNSSSNGRRGRRIGRDTIVVGASAGGVEALQKLLGGLNRNIPAAVFVVVHTSPSSPRVLPQILERAGALPAVYAEDGMKPRPGRIYVAPPDFHLLIKGEVVRITRGPKENGFRPAVDVLFRTAARTMGPRVMAVVLSGALDDGTVGMMHVKNNGGIAIAQDPLEAVFPSMPQSAIDNVEMDHVMPVAKMPALLMELANQPLPRGVIMPKGNGQPDVAEVGRAMLADSKSHGPPTSITCPDCGGSLWERKDGKVFRYQCHVGHSYTTDSLISEKNEQLESVLWGALRALEESADLRRRMARRASRGPRLMQDLGMRYEQDAQDTEQQAAVLRELLTQKKDNGKRAGSTKEEEKAKAAVGQTTHANIDPRRRQRHKGEGNRRGRKVSGSGRAG